jgi:lipid-A-disaccharide synthase
MLVLFPFEERFYEEEGVPVTFVGHPVVERLPDPTPRPDLLETAGFDPSRPVVALLPGSRRSEIGRLLAPMLDAAVILHERHPDLQFLIPRAATLEADLLQRPVDASGLRDVRVHAGDFPDILTACVAGAVASGTASLESAVAGLPMAIVYRMSPFSYAVGRLLVRVEHIGMPNLIAGDRLVPELIQGACNGPAIAAEIERYLTEPAQVRAVKEGLAEVRRRLGGPGAYRRAAQAILEEIGG